MLPDPLLNLQISDLPQKSPIQSSANYLVLLVRPAKEAFDLAPTLDTRNFYKPYRTDTTQKEKYLTTLLLSICINERGSRIIAAGARGLSCLGIDLAIFDATTLKKKRDLTTGEKID